MLKRLFERSSVTTPDLTTKLASGKAGEAATNITWQNVLTWLQDTALNFLKPSNNLSDVSSAITARTNLDVYDTGTIDTALGLKANSADVLEKTNTTSFAPTGDFNPATKKYVDEGGVKIDWADGTIISAKVDPGSFIRCCKVGPIVYVTGQIQLTATAADGEVLLRLPGTFPLFTENFYFASNDGGAGESIELRAGIGSRDIIKGPNGQNDTFGFFGVAIPVI